MNFKLEANEYRKVKRKNFNAEKTVLLEDSQEKEKSLRIQKLNMRWMFRRIKRKHSNRALFRFYLTLTFPDTIKSKQDPAQVKLW